MSDIAFAGFIMAAIDREDYYRARILVGLWNKSSLNLWGMYERNVRLGR